jgi:ASC-1-like (ASCH) protein
MLTNFKGDISIGDIINKNLIDISIVKAKKYDVVKTKIREQIIDNITVRTKESFKDTQSPVFKKDLAVNDNGLIAYEGNEFSFI